MSNIVAGMEKFIEYFKNYSENYIIVGGTATNAFLNEAGLDMRITKDIDIIIVAENLNKEFGNVFWKFIKDGKYNCYRSKDDNVHYYRFINYKNYEFPHMIELFSKKEKFIGTTESIFTPVVVDDDISSLSAIILEDEYYNFLISGKKVINNISVLDPLHLIAFKAKAHVDLTRRKKQGIFVNERDSKKHKNDIFRLLQLLTINDNIYVSNQVKYDIQEFIEIIKDDNIDVSLLTNNVLNYEEAIELLKKAFNL